MSAMSLEERMEFHRLFWAGRAPRPIMGFFVPGGPGVSCPNVDIDTPTAKVVEKYRALAAWHNAQPGDRVFEARPNYGTSFLPALAGAQYRHDGHTSWTIPLYERVEQVRVPALDRDHPLWRSFEEKIRALAEARIPGALVTGGAMEGPLDTLAALVGPERFCTELVDAPEAVEAKARECLRLWLEVRQAVQEAAGRPPGATGFGVFIPGKGAMWSEDAFALVGPAQFERFFRPVIRELASKLERSFLHTHSLGWACYQNLAKMQELDAVEISNDPNGPPVETIVRAGVEFQRRGKGVMFSNWNKPLSEAEVEHILRHADPRRTVVTLTVGSLEEAQRWMARVRQMFGGP